MTEPMTSEAVERVLRDIPGYEGLYSVTADGRVWAAERTWRCGRDGSRLRIRPAGWLRPNSGRGYPAVSLTKDGEARTWLVHRLVALTWIPNPRGLPQVNHINGVKSDPRAENLEWVTPSENVRHAWATGLNRVSEKMREHGRRLPRPERGTHCAHGHELTPENSIEKKGGGRGCRVCQRAYHRAWKHRLKGAQNDQHPC